MDKKGFVFPKYLIAIILILVVCLIFLIAVQIPFASQKLPVYNRDHASATSQINVYKDYLNRASAVEADIKRMQQEYEEKNRQLSVDPDQTVDDIRDMLIQIGYDPSTITVSNSSADSKGRVAATGDPLYQTTIGFTFTASKQDMLDTFRYFEAESKGSYFITSLAITPAGGAWGEESTALDSYNVSMSITLYYFKAPKTST